MKSHSSIELKGLRAGRLRAEPSLFPRCHPALSSAWSASLVTESSGQMAKRIDRGAKTSPSKARIHMWRADWPLDKAPEAQAAEPLRAL